MKIIKTSKGQDIMVDDEDYEYLSSFTWGITSTGYASMQVNRKCIYMHRLILGLDGGKMCADHKDRNRLNNTRDNLRIATRAENSRNMSKPNCGSSKYKGVSLYKRDLIWCAFLKTGKKTRYLGRFKIEEDAAKAYDRLAMKLFGEFANLNFKYCSPCEYAFRMAS